MRVNFRSTLEGEFAVKRTPERCVQLCFLRAFDSVHNEFVVSSVVLLTFLNQQGVSYGVSEDDCTSRLCNGIYAV